jgi:hypothetical protein
MRRAAYQLWTGAEWSSNINGAMLFESHDADDYVRANCARVSAAAARIPNRI